MSQSQKSGPVGSTTASVPSSAPCSAPGTGRTLTFEISGAAWCGHAGNSQARWAWTEERPGRSPGAEVSRPKQGRVGADQALPSSDGSSRPTDCNGRRTAVPEQCAQVGWNPAAADLLLDPKEGSVEGKAWPPGSFRTSSWAPTSTRVTTGTAGRHGTVCGPYSPQRVPPVAMDRDAAGGLSFQARRK